MSDSKGFGATFGIFPPQGALEGLDLEVKELIRLEELCQFARNEGHLMHF